jgi:hypothetical protein
MISFTDAIVELRPNEPWVCVGNTLDGLTFHNPDVTKPTQKEIDDTIKALEAKEAAKHNAKAALLERLGITDDEAALLLA